MYKSKSIMTDRKKHSVAFSLSRSTLRCLNQNHHMLGPTKAALWPPTRQVCYRWGAVGRSVCLLAVVHRCADSCNCRLLLVSICNLSGCCGCGRCSRTALQLNFSASRLLCLPGHRGVPATPEISSSILRVACSLRCTFETLPSSRKSESDSLRD
jgi:hypothetical protein